MLFPGSGPATYLLLRFFAGRARARLESGILDARAAQAARLRLIVQNVRGTAFEQAHAMRGDEDLHAWREAVPVRTFDELYPYLEHVARGEPRVLTRERVRSLLETSGTTGQPKWLPVTDSWAQTVADAQSLWMLGLLRDDPDLAAGKVLAHISPAEHAVSSGGLAVGANTGRMFLAQPWWLQARAAVPYAACCIDDADVRAYTVLRHAVTEPITSWTAANPSTILLYCRHLQNWWEELAADCRDGTLTHGPAARLDASSRALLARGLRRRTLPAEPYPAAIWPLRRINCWTGGPAAFFVPHLEAAIGAPVPVREIGITASEGFFAVSVDDGDPIAYLGGHLLEFLDDAGDPHWAWEVEVGREYRLVISTEAGLYRYDIGDVVRITGFEGQAPRMVFVRKAGAILNVVGERVTENQVIAAAQSAFPTAVGLSVSVRAELLPALRVAVEGVGDRVVFDLELQRLNVEYKSRRETGRMGPPVVVSVAPGTFARWRRARMEAGAPEAQVKDPVVLEPERWDALVRA